MTVRKRQNKGGLFADSVRIHGVEEEGMYPWTVSLDGGDSDVTMGEEEVDTGVAGGVGMEETRPVRVGDVKRVAGGEESQGGEGGEGVESGLEETRPLRPASQITFTNRKPGGGTYW